MIELLVFLIGCMVLLSLWSVFLMVMTSFWLIPLALPIIASMLFVRLTKIVFSLAINHFPWFVVMVLTVYILTTWNGNSAKQDISLMTLEELKEEVKEREKQEEAWKEMLRQLRALAS